MRNGFNTGFTWDGTKVTTYDDLNSDGNTSLIGIGPQGQIYGNMGQYGLVYLDDTYHPFTVPSQTDAITQITSFSADGSIVGVNRGGLTKGFVATCPPRHVPCAGIR